MADKGTEGLARIQKECVRASASAQTGHWDWASRQKIRRLKARVAAKERSDASMVR